jgi:hypothetical protein
VLDWPSTSGAAFRRRFSTNCFEHAVVLGNEIKQGRGAISSGSTGGALMPGKRVQFDDETWQAVDLLARDRMMDFQELAEEAFRDLLRKYDRPADLKSALRQSLGKSATIHELAPKRPKGRRHRGAG